MSEYLHVEKPFLDQLATLGWTVIDQAQGGVPSDPAVSLRLSFREWILPDVFRDSVRALNLLPNGEPWLTDRQLEDLRNQILRQPQRNVLEANEAVQRLLLKAQVDVNEQTGELDPVVRLIDFAHPERNRFHAISQFRVDTPGCVKSFVIPDIVLFVNGLPLVVVEAKVPDPNTGNPLHAAFQQLLRYRDGRPETRAAGLREGEPRLFYTNLLLVRTSGERADFGTITSEEKHFYAWRYTGEGRPERAAADREQEQLVEGLLSPATLLDVLRTSTVFMDTDAGVRVKVVCRYQQYRAARRILERLRTGRTMEDRSGVVWHTQGSGKSLAMVFLARMLRASPDLADFKILLVNDRVDLERQLGRTAKLIGGRIRVIESTTHLRRQLATGASDVNLVMIHKFAERPQPLPAALARALGTSEPLPPSGTFGLVNNSSRILLMIDEAHRTQSSDLGDNLFAAFPNAARIAFTGTPLITEQHGARRTVKRFGPYLDTYKLRDSVRDGATLPILYEGRTAETALDDRHGFDTRFEDLFRDRTEEELLAIKKKYGTSGDILEAEQRIGAIARNLVDHYLDVIFPDGFKAQVVCSSKLAAVRYLKAIRAALADRLDRERLDPRADPERLRRIAKLRAVVVVSADAENELAEVTAARREAQRWNAVASFCKPFDFDDPDQSLSCIAILIVCDMLMTGFDAPVEQVMYLDKPLREHNLLQAIARVNRVAHNKYRGFVVDYIGLANHLAEALELYAREDAEDLDLGLRTWVSELPILEERYQRLLQHFREGGVGDFETYLHGTGGSVEAEVRILLAALASLEDLKRRADFEVYLKKFLESLNLILPRPAAQPYRGPARRLGYLLRQVKERYKDDSLDLADAGEKVKALINEHLIELGINPKIPPVELLADDFLEQVQRHSHGDAEAKASEMEHALRKHCTVRFDEDPAFYRRMSEKLERLIREHRDNWEALARSFEDLRGEVLAGRVEPTAGLSREAAPFYELAAQVAFEGGQVAPEAEEPLRELTGRVLEILRRTIGVVDFWRKPTEVRRLRGILDTEVLLAGIPQLEECHERVAVELLKLAEKRHQELIP